MNLELKCGYSFDESQYVLVVVDTSFYRRWELK